MPDLNSVPPSPHSLSATPNQPSSMQTTPQKTSAMSSQSSSINILPSNQDAVSRGHSRRTSLNPPPALASDAGVGPGPGPVRHPRPLTTSELHMELEKEQEAVVNRLTRELSLLRAAQNASVASNASSASVAASAFDTLADHSLLSGSAYTIPTSRRHHRSSSSASQNPGLQPASPHEARHAIPRSAQSTPLSRQSSHSRISRTNSPGPLQNALDPSSYFHSQRVPHASSASMASVAATPGSMSYADQLSPGLLPATSRFEETAFYRNELDSAKKENEALKRRIRELERMVHSRRTSDASRPRSDSVSTTASVSVAPPGGVSVAGPRDSGMPPRPERERGATMQSAASASGSVAVGVPEDEVKVGESAASAGVTRQKQ